MAINSNLTLRLLADLRLCFGTLTRIPMHGPGNGEATTLARAAWAFPLIGLVVGAIGAVVYAIASAIGFPAWIAAPLAIAAAVLATGGMHEDGLADVADGFGGGRDRESKLAIMRDSRTGAFGVLALLLATALRIGALVAIARPAAVAVALVIAGALSRAAIVWAMLLGRSARDDGLGVAAGRADPVTAGGATAMALLAAILIVGPTAAILAAAATFGAGLAVLGLAVRQIRGTTGDVYGAVQQIAEIAALMVLLRVLG